MTTDVFDALSVVILSTLAVLDNVVASITDAPQNTVSLAGHSVTFQCTTNITDRPVYWQFTNVNGVLQPPIYTGIMNPAYASRGFSVSNLNSSKTSEYNLTIARVNLTDAGTYTCQDNNGIGEARAAWLTVLDADPSCPTVTSTVTVTCTSRIYGRISDSNRLVPDPTWYSCSNVSESFSIVQNDSFYRHYTWQSYLNTNATRIFSLRFTAVVSDATIDNRLPIYRFSRSIPYRQDVFPTTAAALSTTVSSLSPPKSFEHRNAPLGGNTTTNGTTTDTSFFNTTSNSTTATTVGCPVIVLFLGCLSLVHHLDLP